MSVTRIDADALISEAMNHVGHHNPYDWVDADVQEIVRWVAVRVEQDVMHRVEALIGQCIEDEVLCAKSKRAAIMHRNGALLDLRVRLHDTPSSATVAKP